MVEVGDTAPDFTLQGSQGDTIREFTLSEFADGRPVAVVFYIYDYSPVCTDQVCEVDDAEFLTFNDDIRVLGISTDGPYSHRQFIADTDISYPLLTDDDMRVYEDYGLVDRKENGRRATKRGLVLLDSERTVRYRWEADDNWDEWQPEPLHDVHNLTEELGD